MRRIILPLVWVALPTLPLHVEDVDEHFEHARQSGARILRSPTDMPFGERQYTVEDPWGHRWTFSQSIADVPPEAWGARQPNPK